MDACCFGQTSSRSAWTARMSSRRAEPVYLAGTLLLGIGFLAYAVGFSLRRSRARAGGAAGVVDRLAACNPLVAGQHSARIESPPFTEPSGKERSDRGDSPGPKHVDFRPGLAAGRVDPQPVRPGLRHHRVHLPRGRRVLLYSIVPLPARRGGSSTRSGGAAPGLRQQADRDRLDGGAGADRLHPGPGHDPDALGGERARRRSPRAGTTRSSSRWSAASGGGSTPTTTTTAGSWASRRPTSCTSRPARTAYARPVYLTLKSADVCHSFWVPRLARQDRPDPGPHQLTCGSRPTEPGLFVGQCAEYCGTQHANMLIRVVVDSPERLRALAGERAEAGRGRPVGVARARRRSWRSRASTATGCAAPRRGAPTRPDLTHLMSRETLAVGHGPEHAREPAPLGRRPADRSSRAA